MITTNNDQLVLGVDTHLEVHVAAIMNPAGQLLGSKDFSVSTTGYIDLWQWAGAFGNLSVAGVEGTRT